MTNPGFDDAEIEKIRLAYLAANDPAEQFATAICAAFTPRPKAKAARGRGVDAVAMLRELAADIDSITRDRQARDARNAHKARRAYAQFEQARAAILAEPERQDGPSLVVAAAMHMGQAPVRVF